MFFGRYQMMIILMMQLQESVGDDSENNGYNQ